MRLKIKELFEELKNGNIENAWILDIFLEKLEELKNTSDLRTLDFLNTKCI